MQGDPGDMQASPEFRPAAVSADALADGQWRRQTDNHGHGRALVPPDAITGAPETAVTVLRERAEVAEQRTDDAVTMAERTLGQLVVVQAKLAEAKTGWAMPSAMHGQHGTMRGRRWTPQRRCGGLMRRSGVGGAGRGSGRLGGGQKRRVRGGPRPGWRRYRSGYCWLLT